MSAGSSRPAGGEVPGAGVDRMYSARRQAAVVAVALARAEQEARPLAALDLGEAADQGSVSPWWALHHGRQLELGTRTRRTR